MRPAFRHIALALTLTLAPSYGDEALLKTITGTLLLGKFKELDRNGDGKITAEEAGNAPWFKRFDVNGDGAVTADEIREALAATRRTAAARPAIPAGPLRDRIEQARQGETAAARPALPSGTPEEIFKNADKNGDGKITRAELPNPELFKQFDTNGDGIITFEEAKPVLERMIARNAAKQPPATVSAPVPARQGPKILKPGDVGVGRMIQEVAFNGLAGKSHKLSDFHAAKGVVIAFTSTTCPVSKRYAPSLARLEAELREKGIPMLLVNPFTSEKPDSLQADVKAHGFASPYVHDRIGALARALDARSTTEVFLLDGTRTLIYRGALDDQYGTDYNRGAPRERYLITAVDALLAGKRPEIAATEAPGCELDLPPAARVAITAVTYHRDVARILQQNCVRCHHDKGIAPFALDDIEGVKDRAKVLRRVLEDGTMPPWFAAPVAGAKTSPWANDCSLSARDKTDLLAWLNSLDRPVGDPADAPSPLKPFEEWTIGKPDLVVQLTKPFSIKPEGVMPYQFSTVETTLTEDKWVKAYEIMPTAREVVHHVIVHVHPKGVPFNRGGDEGAEGYWAAYVPGNSTHVYPDGVARKLPAGATVSFQIHYTPNGKATEDQLRMGLIFSNEPPRFAVHTVSVIGRKLSIPAGDANHVETAQRTVPTDLDVTAFMAHMHVRGKAFKFDVTYPDGRTETLLDIPRYDFNWQLRYDYKEAHRIPRGSTLKITAVYDNSAANKANPDPTKTVRWGPQTSDEMMVGYIEHFTPLPGAGAATASAK